MFHPLYTFTNNPVAQVVVTPKDTGAGRKRRYRKKVFVEQDGEILLFDTPDQAYAYLQAKKSEAVVKHVSTGKKVRKPKVEKFTPVEMPEVIKLTALSEYVDFNRLSYDVDLLIRNLNIKRLIKIQEQMNDDEDEAIILMLMDD